MSRGRVSGRLALAAVILLAACKKSESAAVAIQTAPVERRDIVIDVEASGTVEPINVVEVKSKASGQIVQMPVDIGTLVKPRDLLVQIDTRDVKNQYDQAAADLRAAQAKLNVSAAQKKRSDDLFGQRIISAQEHESATLDYADAQAQVVRTRAALDLARQRLEDATVRAPTAGTVIEKDVSQGQVITSATGNASGGTTILKMADLNQVRVRALVNETDIGNVRASQQATVTVDAFPDRPFQGYVEQIQPQATVQQSVTLFPVLVSVSNRDGSLKPGMNGDVAILVSRRSNVLAVPNDAVRSVREAASVATMLGLDPAAVQAQVRELASAARTGGGAAGAAGARTASSGAVDLAQNASSALDGQATPRTSADGARRADGAALPAVGDSDCVAVQSALAKAPSARARLDSIRARVRSGDLDMQQARAASQQVYAALHVDGRIARACGQRARGDSAGGIAAGAIPGSTRSRQGLVFVVAGKSYAPRIVRLGVANYDYTEVQGGLKEGEVVTLLASAALQAQRQQQQDRIRNATGGAVPGMGGGGGARAGGARGGP